MQIISFNNLTIDDINYLNEVKRNNPKLDLTVRIDNTKGLTSNMLRKLNDDIKIHIIGGNTLDRIEKRGGKNVKFTNGESMDEYYIYSCTYTKQEAISILEEFEKIERNIGSNWSDEQVVVYLYSILKSNISYDPLFEQKSSREVRNLIGVVTKSTICAGYALILKEFLDRREIECHFVEGTVGMPSGGHAWNLVKLNGKLYPFDLTWDSNAYTRGNFKNINYFGQNNSEFRASHIPNSYEPIQNYEKSLSSFDLEYAKDLFQRINRERDYNTTTYHGKRKDNSEFFLSQIGTNKINGQEFYRYLYADKENGKLVNKCILYSETNVALVVDAKSFNTGYNASYENFIDNKLFSKENIQDSLNRNTGYIGNAYSIREYLNEGKEPKPANLVNLFSLKTKTLTRSDNTEIVVQQTLKEPLDINGNKVMRYDLFEIIEENGKRFPRRNTVWTENNLIENTSPLIADSLLSRKRLDRKVGETGGYIGKIDESGKIVSKSSLIDYFTLNKNDTIELKETNTQTKKVRHKLPSFEEVKEFASKYNFTYDEKTNKFTVTDSITNETIEDKELVGNVIFANLWLTSAGVKWSPNEKKPGLDYAFNDSAKDLYNLMVLEITQSLEKDGNINTLKLLETAQILGYKHSNEILINLFRSDLQTKIIDKYFRNRIDSIEKTLDTQPLYSFMYVGNLINNASKRKL